MNKYKILYLSQEDVKKCITVRESIDSVEEGMKLCGNGKTIHPPKIYMEIEKYHGFIKPMIAFADEPMNISATKNFSFFPENRKTGLPTVHATIILNNPQNGLPLAIMDGTIITALRTAATTAVAAKYLAKTDSNIIGIFGAGVQGRSHLLCLSELFDISSVRVGDISKKYRDEFAKEMSKKLGIEVKAVEGKKDVVRGADIIITCTTGNEPLVMKEDVEPGMFIGKVGSYQEIDFGVIDVVDKYVIDFWEYVSHRVPEIRDAKVEHEDIYAEIAEIVAGRKKGRINSYEKILFVSIGMGIEDAAVGLKVYENAKTLNIGKWLEA